MAHISPGCQGDNLEKTENLHLKRASSLGVPLYEQTWTITNLVLIYFHKVVNLSHPKLDICLPLNTVIIMEIWDLYISVSTQIFGMILASVYISCRCIYFRKPLLELATVKIYILTPLLTDNYVILGLVSSFMRKFVPEAQRNHRHLIQGWLNWGGRVSPPLILIEFVKCGLSQSKII